MICDRVYPGEMEHYYGTNVYCEVDDEVVDGDNCIKKYCEHTECEHHEDHADWKEKQEDD